MTRTPSRERQATRTGQRLPAPCGQPQYGRTEHRTGVGRQSAYRRRCGFLAAESGEVLAELREVAWRVYPTALDSLGLRKALGGVAERCALPVRVTYDVSGPLPQSVETAAYFVVSESVTNAAKHSGAGHVLVSLARRGEVLTVLVRDDGAGGADPEGGGLSGLRGRVAAIDGMLEIRSPAGGPTTVTAELPCV
ncbi:ATP-binding protein [Streptomyces sp. NPDC047939]|uniref:sensor histidine kinase n=1 Tax=Streptomyces sp. NPDC047939 TaxID=3155381 RepID=UPI00343D34F8